MENIIKVLFLLTFIFIFYAYFGYPVSLMMIGFMKKRHNIRDTLCLNVTLIITVHNEEKRIIEKLKNSLSVDYPVDKLQIIVASDGSSDETNQIVRNYEKNGVILLAIPERRGKESAQKAAVKIAIGDVFVFSDVATTLPPESLRQIISNFADKTVGAVSGEDRLIGKNSGYAGESLYVRYEMWLRRLESNVNSIVGLSGSFFAARREVCEDFSEDVQSDFRTVLNCIKKGFRAISDPKAIGYYEDVSDKRHEFDRKIRTVLRGLTVYFRNIEFLNFMKYGFFSYQYFCHKLLRWLVPFFLLIAFATNLILSTRSVFYIILFFCQTLFYGLGISGLLKDNVPISKIEKIPGYFITVNLAILNAWYKYIKGERIILWAPSQR